MSTSETNSAVNLTNKLASFDEHWAPRTVSLFNGHDIMVAKIKGPYHWHKHDDTDDFFYVVSGKLQIEMRDHVVHLKAGDLYVVPKGVEHRPVADGEVEIMLIEKTGTPNSGDAATAAPRRKI
jgi:mannose-6-phosphate isomerase-like protein (cupin superfamily)